MFFKSFTALLLYLVLSTISVAQTRFSVHTGLALPMADFSNGGTGNIIAGKAASGFNIGAKYVFPISESRIGLFVSTDLMYQGLKKSAKDELEDFLTATGYEVNIKYVRYVNLPIVLGLNYTYNFNDEIAAYTDAGLGVSFFKVTDAEVTVNQVRYQYKFDLAAALGYSLGGGVMFRQRVTLGANYHGLGKQKVKGDVLTTGSTTSVDSGTLRVAVFTVIIGVKI